MEHENKQMAGVGLRKFNALVRFFSITEKPPRNDEEYLVCMGPSEIQDLAFTVALWVDGQWFPDAGDDSTITHWADLSVFHSESNDKVSGAGHTNLTEVKE